MAVTQNSINLNAAGIPNYDGIGTFAGISLTNHAILIGAAANFITSTTLTSGQLLIGSTGADPAAATLTAGAGISITNGAGSISIASVGGGITWTVVAGAALGMVIDSGYIANNAGTCVLTLPAAAVVGSIIEVTGINNATGWQIAQNAGQTIYLGASPTTTGAAGSLTSTAIRDSVKLVCVVANNDWNVLSVVGNITVA